MATYIDETWAVYSSQSFLDHPRFRDGTGTRIGTHVDMQQN